MLSVIFAKWACMCAMLIGYLTTHAQHMTRARIWIVKVFKNINKIYIKKIYSFISAWYSWKNISLLLFFKQYIICWSTFRRIACHSMQNTLLVRILCSCVVKMLHDHLLFQLIWAFVISEMMPTFKSPSSSEIIDRIQQDQSYPSLKILCDFYFFKWWHRKWSM